jgi:hypothetical protein
MKSKTGHDVVEYASRNHVDSNDELLKIPTLENEQFQSDKSQLTKNKDHSTDQLDKQTVSGPFKKIAEIARQKLNSLSKIYQSMTSEVASGREEWHRQKHTRKFYYRQPPSGFVNPFDVNPVTPNSFPRFMVTHPCGCTTHTLDRPFTRYTISDLLTYISSDESFSEEEESDVYWGPGWYY